MQLVRGIVPFLITSCFLNAQSFDDPVMRIRAQRAETQGINESDLPPVPKNIMMPPPLPEPEPHVKDSLSYSIVKTVTPNKLKDHSATRIVKLKNKSNLKHTSDIGPVKTVILKRYSRLAVKAVKSAKAVKAVTSSTNKVIKDTRISKKINSIKTIKKTSITQLNKTSSRATFKLGKRTKK